MRGQDLEKWVEEKAAHFEPSRIVWIHGDKKEHQAVLEELVKEGIAIPLNQALRPLSYLFRSDPRDVARVEDRTFICSSTEEEAGPTNHWSDPKKMRGHLQELFKGSMKGRTMYIIPYAMGPLTSPFAKYGVQLTDSLYVVAQMALMTTVGDEVLKKIQAGGKFVPCLHSVGVPEGDPDFVSKWPCRPEKLVVAHFPEEREIWSFGSGYGGNALLGKKCLALRIASVLARDEGWLAEHMLIVGITNPKGEKKYFLGAFPSASGKTNLALLTPDLPGWKVETVGDDIAWIRPGKDGRLYAVNPEAGFFGVAPGTSEASNPKAMETIKKNTLFTNVALAGNGDVYWEGMGVTPTLPVTTWLDKPWDGKEKAAHSNARFTVAIEECPYVDQAWASPEGVPISGILFGGRRSDRIPLVMQAKNWRRGVLYGAALSSETTAAATGTLGKLRHDPFAMLPFCGYHMGDYFRHWLSFETLTSLPQVFLVNWFRKDGKGDYLWPGYGANTRVMKWIFERCDDQHEGVTTPIGILPKPEEIDTAGIQLKEEALNALLSYNAEDWTLETEELKRYFQLFGPKFPHALMEELRQWENR